MSEFKKKKPNLWKKKNDNDSSDYSFDDGYDENLYKDEADKEFLESLPEVERENILSERYKKRKQEKERRKLEHEAKAKDYQKDKRGAALTDLTQRRLSQKEKKEKFLSANYSDNESSEEEKQHNKKRKGDSDEEYGPEEGLTKKRKRSKSNEKATKLPEKKVIAKGDLEKIRLSRKTLEMLCPYDHFSRYVVGCYVRVNMADARKQQAANYIIAKIIDVRNYKSYYKMGEKETNKVLYLQYGKKEWQFKMIFVSNSEFSESEFTNWVLIMQKAGMPIPTYHEIEVKAEELKKGLNHRISSEDIKNKVNQRIDEKIRKGEKLTLPEITNLEERATQYELDYFRSGNKKTELKLKADHIRESIKKSKAILFENNNNNNNNANNGVNKNKQALPSQNIIQNKMEIEYEKFNYSNEDFLDDKYKVEEEEEEGEERDYDYRKYNEMNMHNEENLNNNNNVHTQSKVLTISELNEEIKKEFKKIHDVQLSIDNLIDEWDVQDIDKI